MEFFFSFYLFRLLVLASVPLGNYQPIKIFNTNFELGVTRTNTSSPNQNTSHKYQAPPPPPPRTHSNGKGKIFFWNSSKMLFSIFLEFCHEIHFVCEKKNLIWIILYCQFDSYGPNLFPSHEWISQSRTNEIHSCLAQNEVSSSEAST